jgi:hypothetical protein
VFLALFLVPTVASTPSALQEKKQYDPFEVKPPKRAPTPKQALKEYEIAPPGLSQRVDACKSNSTAFGASSTTTPCPYLVSEMKITGVYSGDGLSALAIATPNNQSVYLQVGDRLYDGEVTEIVEADANTEAYVVFKKWTRFRSKGGERVETKSVTLKLVP